MLQWLVSVAPAGSASTPALLSGLTWPQVFPDSASAAGNSGAADASALAAEGLLQTAGYSSSSGQPNLDSGSATASCFSCRVQTAYCESAGDFQLSVAAGSAFLGY